MNNDRKHAELVDELLPVFRDGAKASSPEGRKAIATLEYLFAATRACTDAHPDDGLISSGALQASEFLNCLTTGQSHPLLDFYIGLRSMYSSRPVMTAIEEEMQIAVAAAAQSMKRKFLRRERGQADDLAALAAVRSGAFSSCTKRTVEKWREKYSTHPTLAKHLAVMEPLTAKQVEIACEAYLSQLANPAPAPSLNNLLAQG